MALANARIPPRKLFIIFILSISSFLFITFHSYQYDIINISYEQYSHTVHSHDITNFSHEQHHCIVLHAPHDRFNFGDLLFAKVVKHLLMHRAGYRENEILMSGLISINMSVYDGDSNIIAFKEIINMSHMDTIAGPYDLVSCGGEAANCGWECGAGFFPTKEMRQKAEENRINTCPYMPAPSLLRIKGNNSNSSLYTGKHPIGIINSLGGMHNASSEVCRNALKEYDYISWRDKEPLAADSAVMVNHLFKDKIMQRFHDRSSRVFAINQETNGRMFAFQALSVTLRKHNASKLAEMLDRISNENNLSTVFFCAGNVPGHDRIGSYHRIGKYMKSKYFIMDEAKVWSVVALIANARLVFSTSLHVRIMAFIHYRPRIMYCHHKKHYEFVRLFEAKDVSQCHRASEFYFYSDDWLLKQVSVALNADVRNTNVSVAKARASYLISFDKWSKLVMDMTE